jgi:ferredoxin
MNVMLDRDKCIGCSACTTVCPEYWSMAADGKSTMSGAVEAKGKRGWLELEIKNKAEEECHRKAADICPVKVIHVQ